jgi:hypothetical protein
LFDKLEFQATPKPTPKPKPKPTAATDPSLSTEQSEKLKQYRQWRKDNLEAPLPPEYANDPIISAADRSDETLENYAEENDNDVLSRSQIESLKKLRV